MIGAGRQPENNSAQLAPAGRLQTSLEPQLLPADQSNLADDFQGRRLDPAWTKGPAVARSVSDIVCCILFLILLAVSIATVLIHAPKSRLGLLGKPKDTENNICGYTKGFADHPYLFTVNFGKDKRTVCVKECPRFDYNQLRYNSSGTTTYISRIPRVLPFGELAKAASEAGTQWDGITRSPPVTGPEDPALFLYNPPEALGYYSEAAFMAYLRRWSLDCVPTSRTPACKYDPDKKFFVYDTRPAFSKVCLPRSPFIAQKTGLGSQFGSEDLLGSLQKVWLVLVLAAITALLVNLLLVASTMVFPQTAVWIATILGLLTIFGLFLLFFFLAVDVSASGSVSKSFGAKISNLDWALTKMKPHVWVLYTVSGLLILLVAWILYRVIRNSRYFPLAAVLLSVSAQLFLLPLWLYQALILYTSGDLISMADDTVPTFKSSNLQITSQVGLALVMLWSLAAINNLGDYMNAWTTSEQYFQVEDTTNPVAKLQLLEF